MNDVGKKRLNAVMNPDSKLEGKYTDNLSPEKRSETMSKIRSKNTLAENKVRSALHRAGFRFRIHKKSLPGNPDVVLPKHKIAVFVHGCFWHRHMGCSRMTFPKSNKLYWEKKFNTNVLRDKRARDELTSQGWLVRVIWECEVKKSTPEKIVEVIMGITPNSEIRNGVLK